MESLNFKRIGSKIKERRIIQGLTQDYVAEKLNVNPSHISNIECGRANPSLSALVNIARILECSVDYFIAAEYDFAIDRDRVKSYDYKILEMLQTCDIEKKEKILKIIELLI